MYYYIIDPQKIDQKTFERVQNQLYSSLSELKISGEMTRVTSLRTINQLVESAAERGATTIVAVGDDGTAQETISAIGEKDLTMGYVPLGKSEMGEIIGAGDVVEACRNLAQRRTEVLDLGRIGNNYFFTNIAVNTSLETIQARSIFDLNKFSEAANIKPAHIKLEVDGEFSAEFEAAIGLIVNSRAGQSEHNKLADPTDDILDILFLPQISSFDAWKYRKELAAGELEKIPGCSVMHGKQLKISGEENLGFYMGNRAVAKSQATIDVIPKKIRMIVGKNRTF